MSMPVLSAKKEAEKKRKNLSLI
jgi:hypothetical protein